MFVRGKNDNTLFIYKTKGNVILVQRYVDEIIFESTSHKLCKQFEKPMVPPNNLRPDMIGKSANESIFRGMIGSLM